VPYYIFRKSIKTDVWKCLERYNDLQVASKAKNAYNMTLLQHGDTGVFLALIVADTETSAKAALDLQDAQRN
jgi:hypothetical protein